MSTSMKWLPFHRTKKSKLTGRRRGGANPLILLELLSLIEALLVSLHFFLVHRRFHRNLHRTCPPPEQCKEADPQP